MEVRPVKYFVKLLSVSLFQVMEEGEIIFHPQLLKNTSTQEALQLQINHIQDWLALLPHVDAELPKNIWTELMQKSEHITSQDPEIMLNATALTLMLLDDHYHIFSMDVSATPSAFLPIMQLQDIKPDIPVTKPTLIS